MESIWNDIRYGVRQLAGQPGFTVVAVLTLALGIGANVAIFSTLEAVLLKTLPVEKPEELVLVLSDKENSSFSYPLWEQLRERQDVFSGVFVRSNPRFNLALGGEVRYAQGLWVSGAFFSTLGVQPHIGRLLTPEDDRRGGPNAVAVLGYAFWQREHGGKREILGQQIHLDGHPFEIVGVAQPGFFGVDVGRHFDVAIPIVSEKIIRGERSGLDRPTHWWMNAFGRLKPGVTSEQANAQLQVISRAAFEATTRKEAEEPYRSEYQARVFNVRPAAGGMSTLRARYTRALYILMGVVGLVLLIACANIANLLLARAAARQKEMGVRLALGASRGRLIRQLLTESLLLAAGGTLLAAPLASIASNLLVQLISTSNFQVFLDMTPDARVIGFVAGLALLTTVLFGLAPALRATRVSLAEAMKQTGPQEPRGRMGLGKALVIVQVAISMVLVGGAALLLRTFHNLTSLDAGFEPARVLLVTLDLRKAATPKEQRTEFYEQLLERVRALPGVLATAQSDITPISGSSWNSDLQVDGYVSKGRGDSVAYFNAVTPDFFATLGTPFIDGRDFTPQDRLKSPRVAIVNQAFAKKFFPGRNPVGDRYYQGATSEKREATEIIGLVKDAKYQTLREETLPTVYVPILQDKEPQLSRNLAVRAAGDPMRLASAVRDAIAEINPQIAIQFRKFETQVADSLTQDRVLATLSGFFGGLALLLSCVGLYGLLAHAVARRRREIGIRMALGSTPQAVLRLILGDGVRLAVLGVAVGAVATYFATKVLATFLFGVGARDPLTLTAAGALLIGVAVAACSGAARKAARIEPWSALRHE